MSFALSPFAPKKTHTGIVNGLKNFYITSQWLQPPGGLPNAAITGKFTIQRICEQLKKQFIQ